MGIVDIKLPDIEGVKLVEKLAELSPWLEYVIITGYASLESAVEAIRHKNIVVFQYGFPSVYDPASAQRSGQPFQCE